MGGYRGQHREGRRHVDIEPAFEQGTNLYIAPQPLKRVGLGSHEIGYAIDATGAPVLDGAIAHFDCELAHEYQLGSHSILVGRVLSCSARPGSPLGYFNGGFHDFGIHVD